MECDELIKAFLHNYKYSESAITGFLNHTEIDSFLDCLKALGYSFYKRNSIVYETCKRYKSSKIRYSYGTKIPFFGSPFLITKTVYMRCSQDGDYKPSEKNTSDASMDPNKKMSIQPTKKMGCKAFLHITHLLVFQHLLVQDRQVDKRETSDRIKADLNEHVRFAEKRLLIEMSDMREHNHPRTNENQIIHPALKSEIYRLVSTNVSLIETVKVRLTEMVQQMVRDNKIPQPETNNHCFYPQNEVIRYHINSAKFSLKKEFIDQDTVSALIDEWKVMCDDHFYFQPFSITHNQRQKSVPFFCHQTKWQQYLLNRYGNAITILDPIYKTTGYCFPTYFIIVKTNSSFMPVGTIVMNTVTETSLKEAIQIFRKWNPNWAPKYVLCSHTESEISALKVAFSSSILSICSYRVEHTWKTFLYEETTPEKADELLKLWRILLFSKTGEEFQENETRMKEAELFKENNRIQSYFYKTWYPSREKWILAYQTHEFYVYMNINDGLSSGNVFFAFQLLSQQGSKMLSSVLTTVLQEYLPCCLRDYVDFNTFVEFNSVPDFLVNYSISFMKHVVQSLKVGEYEYRGATIVCTENKKFMLKNSVDEFWYHVDLEDINCTCEDFQKWRFPCMHMCAIFTYTTWTMDTMAMWYLENPFIKFDDSVGQYISNLPRWYTAEKKSVYVEQNLAEEFYNANKKLLTGEEDMQSSEIFVEEMDDSIAENDPIYLKPMDEKWIKETDMTMEKMSTKSSVKELLKSIGDKVNYLSEESLHKCYATLKKLQEDISESSLTPL